jgi:thiosulfate dehydrogenase (quinone) large subunit
VETVTRRRVPVAQPTFAASLRAGWASQPWPSRILRAFLGGTFVYAGIQKFADPNYLHPGTRTYIGVQLHAFSQGTPIGPILSAIAHFPSLVGVGFALLEIVIGLGTLFDVAPITSALAGCLVNVVLFLSASWHIHPYFLGSDSIYAVAWAAYAAGRWETRERHPVPPPRRRSDPHRRSASPPPIARREVLRGAALSMGALVLSGVARALAGAPTLAPSARGARHGPVPSGSAIAPPPTTNGAGTVIAKLDSIPVGGAIPFNDPAQGPAALFRLGPKHVVAYSRTCTHAGCEVGYDTQAKVLYCPCHGAQFDPAHGARVIAGPAPAPLPSIPVSIDPNGDVVAES